MNLEEIKQKTEQFLLQTYAHSNVAFLRGEGSRLYDTQGKDYIDFGSGIGVCSLGYAHPQFTQALQEQIHTLLHTSNLFYNAKQALLAEKLIELSGYEMQVFFSNSGAEANEGAIKLARKYGATQFKNKRYKIITLASSFHGRTLATLKATGQPAMHHAYFSPYPEGFLIANELSEIYTLIDEETCAVMLELIQGEGGIYALPQEEVRALQDFLQERGILLIIDEVQSGIYRSGELFASHVYNLSPDIITLAKGLGGGIPIGATLCKHQNIFTAGDHGSTFGGNFLSAQAGLSVLEILSQAHQNGELHHRIQTFQSHLQGLLQQFPQYFHQAVGLGLMLGLKTQDEKSQKNIIAQSLANGVVVLRSGKNVIRFLPPLLISKEEMQEGFDRLEYTLKNLIS